MEADMLTRTSPVLSDATKASDLIFPEPREVRMRVLSDREIYEMEMQKIFGKIWVFRGHESEIPNSGDFMVRDMGSDSVIVARGKESEVYVTLTVCPHRGMRISTADCGNP